MCTLWLLNTSQTPLIRIITAVIIQILTVFNRQNIFPFTDNKAYARICGL
jgi:hypothetical protein